MVTKSLLAEALALAPAERLELLERLWESLQSDPAATPLTDEQRRELDRRDAEMDANPHLGSTWEDVKARVWPKR
jgi:putative addiction module component (TIGR02574 family)